MGIFHANYQVFGKESKREDLKRSKPISFTPRLKCAILVNCSSTRRSVDIRTNHNTNGHLFNICSSDLLQQVGVYPYHAASCNLFMDIDLVSCTNRSLVIVYLRLYQCNTAPPGPRWDAHFSVFFKFIQCTLTGCVFEIWDTRPWAIQRHFLFVFFPFEHSNYYLIIL